MKKDHFDVGFSFHMDDVDIVSKIHKELSNKYSIFFSPENQRELFKEDQASFFGELFRSTKVNFIFQGEKYGDTKWTRFEEDIIKQRCLEDGWETLGIIKTKKGVKNLKWYPLSNAYIKLYDLKFEILLGIIEYGIQKVGLEKKEESIEDFAKRQKIEREIKDKVARWKDTSEAWTQTKEELTNLFDSLESSLEKIKDNFPYTIEDSNLSFIYTGSQILVRSRIFILGVFWHNGANNLLSNPKLTVRIIRQRTYNKAEGIEFESEYIPDVDYRLNFCWNNGTEDTITTQQLSELLIKTFVELSQNHI